jgi:hypothetical protein
MGHIWGYMRSAYSVLVGKANGRNYLEALGIDWSVILKWILKRWDGATWTGLIWLRIGTMDRFFLTQ